VPDISFYLLPSDSEKKRLYFVCKLVEKAYRNSYKVYILTASEQQSRLLDDQLWTFRTGSFIPHQVYTSTLPGTENQVLIGSRPAPELWQTTIINLSANCPDNMTSADRILEILDNSESNKQAGRKRYRQYQQLGFTIETHKI
jgi:DNA polymerase-3 subunit chi